MTIKTKEGMAEAFDGEDEEPTIEAVIAYLVWRGDREGKTKEELVLMVRKAWDDMAG